MKKEGYILGYEVKKDGVKKTMLISLKYILLFA